MSQDGGTSTATDGTGVGLDTRTRVVTLIVVFAVAVGVTVTYLVLARGERPLDRSLHASGQIGFIGRRKLPRHVRLHDREVRRAVA